MGKKNTMEFMKIRRYVMDLIATGGDSPQKIPTSRKLGEMFGVTHPTALRALQSLASDGYIIACKSGGSITCPARFDMKEMKIFAILTTSGKVAFDIYYHNLVVYALTAELTRRSRSYGTQNLFLNLNGDLTQAISEHIFSGLLLIGVQDQDLIQIARNLQKDDFPVAAFLDDAPGIPCMKIDYQEFYELALNDLLERGKRKIFIPLLPVMPEKDGFLLAMESCLKKFRLPPETLIVKEDSMVAHAVSLERMLSEGVPVDGVICIRHFNPLYELRRIFPEFGQRSRFIAIEFSVFDDMQFSGGVITPDLHPAAKRLIDQFLSESSTRNVWNEKIPLILSERENGLTGKEKNE